MDWARFNLVSVYLTRDFLTVVLVLLAFESRRYLNHDLEVPCREILGTSALWKGNCTTQRQV